MPIIITEPTTGQPFGPGMSVTAHTDIGVIPVDSFWTFTLSDPEQLHTLAFNRNATPNVSIGCVLGIPLLANETAAINEGRSQVPGGANALLMVSLDAPSTGLHEQTPVTIKLDTTTGLPFVVQHQPTSGGGGLTVEQATQLEQTHAQSFLSTALDQLTLIALTTGPTSGFVNANLSTWIFGVIVRIAQVPEEFRVNTPDGDYWTKTLAVVRIYRGSDLWKRVPVHTSSKMITFVDEGLTMAVSALAPIQWALQISVQVSFGEGVTGEVFLMTLP